ncbi:MAG: DUF1203 domain-containing protein [Caldilineaceae bacterium]
MNSLRFVALSTEIVRTYQNGAPDANGQPPERHIAQETGLPCRHCLRAMKVGEPYLILAHRPFPAAQPYAELGPIFLHADACERHAETTDAPAMFLSWERLLIRGYNVQNRIIYGTGQVVAPSQLVEAAEQLLARPELAYLHMRSATNNCYQCRIERG